MKKMASGTWTNSMYFHLHRDHVVQYFVRMSITKHLQQFSHSVCFPGQTLHVPYQSDLTQSSKVK